MVFWQDKIFQFSSVQSLSHSDSLLPHESQHARPPCPSPIPRVYSNSCPSSRWCHPAISSSVFSSPSAPNPSQHKIFKGLKTENLSLAYLTNIIAPRQLLDSASLVWFQALRHPSLSLTRTCAHVPSAWKVHSSSSPSHPDNFPLIS